MTKKDDILINPKRLTLHGKKLFKNIPDIYLVADELNWSRDERKAFNLPVILAKEVDRWNMGYRPTRLEVNSWEELNRLNVERYNVPPEIAQELAEIMLTASMGGRSPEYLIQLDYDVKHGYKSQKERKVI